MKIRVLTGALALLPSMMIMTSVTPSVAAETCAGKTVTINLITDPATPATSGNDVILGSAEQEIIKGLGGDDVICGGGGGDNLQGGSGNDVILPGVGDDVLFGGDGVDTVNYSAATAGVVFNLGLPGADQITGGSGTDAMDGSFENLTGSPFDDVLFGTASPNILKGGTGDDYLQPRAGADVIKGGGGVDVVDFTDATKSLTIDLAVITAQTTGFGLKTITGAEDIVGGGFDDQISGSDAPNELSGGAGDDLLAGRGGNDKLLGNTGSDELRGGTSSDICDGGADSDPDTHFGCEELINFL